MKRERSPNNTDVEIPKKKSARKVSFNPNKDQIVEFDTMNETLLGECPHPTPVEFNSPATIRNTPGAYRNQTMIETTLDSVTSSLSSLSIFGSQVLTLASPTRVCYSVFDPRVRKKLSQNNIFLPIDKPEDTSPKM